MSWFRTASVYSKARRIGVLIVWCVALLLPQVLDAQERVQITFWHHWSANRLEMVDKMIADFETLYPWIEVEHVFSATTGAQDRMGTLLISGAAPEVMMVRGTYAFQFMRYGGFRDLDDLIARDEIDLSMFNSGDLRSFQLFDRTYALPGMSGSAWTNLMFYNKDLLSNAGIDPDRPPQTWTDWHTAARATTRLSESGMILQGGTAIPPFSHAGAWNGALYWSDDWRAANLVTQSAIETAEFLRDMVQELYGSHANFTSFYQASDRFLGGQSSFSFTNNSGFGVYQTADFEWGAALAPVNEQNPEAKPVGLVSSTWAYGIPATIAPEKLEAAWLFLKYITIVEDGGGWFSRVQGRPSPVIEFNQHLDYAQTPYWDVVIAALGYDVAAPPVNAISTIDRAGTQVISGATHPQQALSNAERLLQVLLDEYWQTVGE